MAVLFAGKLWLQQENKLCWELSIKVLTQKKPAPIIFILLQKIHVFKSGNNLLAISRKILQFIERKQFCFMWQICSAELHPCEVGYCVCPCPNLISLNLVNWKGFLISPEFKIARLRANNGWNCKAFEIPSCQSYLAEFFFFFYYTAELFTKWRIGKNRTLVSHFYLVTLYYNWQMFCVVLTSNIC